MVIYISTQAETMFNLNENRLLKFFTKFILILLTPFVPCLVILQATCVKMEVDKLINDWVSSPTESSTIAAATVCMYERKAAKTHHTYAILRLIEACIESLPQLVLLLGYLTVSIIDSEVLSISDNVGSRG